jgi:hypothetical protein
MEPGGQYEIRWADQSEHWVQRSGCSPPEGGEVASSPSTLETDYFPRQFYRHLYYDYSRSKTKNICV